jgi:hypothetical protein
MRDAPTWVPVAILFGLLLLAYLAMWRGWRRRGGRHDLPPLVPVPDQGVTPLLAADGRYFGTTTAGSWLDRVVAQGLGARSGCHLTLSAEGIDVDRAPAAFRIPAGALEAARHDRGIAGKVVPPHGVLVVTWRHGDLTLDTGFRLDPADVSEGGSAGADRGSDNSVTDTHNRWIHAIETLVKEDA